MDIIRDRKRYFKGGTMAEKEHGFMGMIQDGLGIVSQFITASIMSPIEAGAENIMNNIDDRIIKVEKRILRKISSYLVIASGILFLLLSLFFLLTEFLGWSKSLAFVTMGVALLVIGLLLKLGESDR